LGAGKKSVDVGGKDKLIFPMLSLLGVCPADSEKEKKPTLGADGMQMHAVKKRSFYQNAATLGKKESKNVLWGLPETRGGRKMRRGVWLCALV